MRLLGARRLLAWLLLLTAAMTGCAAKEKVRQGQIVRREVVPPAVQVAAQTTGLQNGGPALVRERTSVSHPTSQPTGVQLATFQQEASPPGAPAEIVAAPRATPWDQDRPTLPLDLAMALGMTQGQNPRVAFAQAQ